MIVIDTGSTVFAYDMINNIKYPEIPASSSIDWASISASGNYVVIMFGDTDTRIYDLQGNSVSSFTVNHNHYDLGIDQNGDDFASGISKTGAYDGHIIRHRLSDAAFTELTSHSYAIHTSTRNDLFPGWSYSSFHPSTSESRVFQNEIVAVNSLNPTQIKRFGRIFNNQTDYLAEAFPVPDHDGRRVMFSSNWNESGGRPVQAYVFDARMPCEVSPTTTVVPTVTPTDIPSVPGDTNGDGYVTLIDLTALLSVFGTQGTGLPADFNGDGSVNMYDLTVLLSNFGR